MNFACRIHRRTPDQVAQWHAHAEEFRHDIGHAENRDIAGVQIGGHGVRNKSLFHSRDGIAKPKTSGSMAHIENHATISRLLHYGIDLPIHNDGELLREHMSMDVTRARFLENEVGVTSFWARPEIVHHRNFRSFRAGNGPVHSRPGGMQLVQRSLSPVMSRFYADDNIGVPENGIGAALYIHLVDALFQSAIHSISDDVQKR